MTPQQSRSYHSRLGGGSSILLMFVVLGCWSRAKTEAAAVRPANLQEPLDAVLTEQQERPATHGAAAILNKTRLNDDDDTAAAAPSQSTTTAAVASENDDTTTNNNNNACRTYLAPSTIPGAGLGTFAGRPFEVGDLVTPGDAAVPLVDMAWHNGGDTGHDFLWDEYIWSGETFKGMPHPGHSVDGASFGIGAAPNCYFAQLNVEDSDDTLQRDHANATGPGVGAFTPWHDRQSHATHHIEEGEEIFVDYGYGYFQGEREDIFGLIPFLPDFVLADRLLRRYTATMEAVHTTLERACWMPRPLVVEPEMENDGQQQRSAASLECPISNTTWTELQHDVYAAAQDILGIFPTRTTKALPEDLERIPDILEHGGTADMHYERSIRPLEFLEEHGTCMDHLFVQTSTLPEAGRGAFATRALSAGSVVAPLPLIHLADRSVLDMYARDAFDPTKSHSKGETDDAPVHQQLLLNYCFGHGKSTLLLCPYGVVSSLVNHATSRQIGDDDGDSEQPRANVELRWSDKITAHPEWKDQTLDLWGKSYQTGLGLEYVALRDLDIGEEIFVDYGDEWQAAWDAHEQSWAPPVRRMDVLNADLDGVLPMEHEWEWPIGDVHKNPEAANLWCMNSYRYLQGLPKADDEAYPCKIINRQEVNGEMLYTAELVVRRQADPTDDNDYCDEVFDEVLWALPRDAFQFGGQYEMVDTLEYAQPSSFRHAIRIPDKLFPEAWKNLAEPESVSDESTREL